MVIVTILDKKITTFMFTLTTFSLHSTYSSSAHALHIITTTPTLIEHCTMLQLYYPYFGLRPWFFIFYYTLIPPAPIHVLA